ncbi:MCE family protein [Sesbania bispinosa]|nr:MCE family protein [Sesbania bispinosa]KAJ1387216.1 MCE family protein [Sesbania bispinosa]
MEDLEDPIVVPIDLVEPSATLSQPAADNKGEETTPSSEPTEEKNKVDDISPTVHSLGEATESVSMKCIVNEETLAITNLEKPAEDSNVEKVEMIVRDEV